MFTCARHECTLCLNNFLQAAKACPDYPVILYNVHLHNTLTNTTSSHPLLPTLSSMGLMLQLDSSDGLERDAHYVYYVTAEGGAGIGESYKREMGKCLCGLWEREADGER